MLTDEYQFLHAVAELLVPIGIDTGVVGTELLQFILRHSGVPLTGVLQLYLSACLLKDITE